MRYQSLIDLHWMIHRYLQNNKEAIELPISGPWSLSPTSNGKNIDLDSLQNYKFGALDINKVELTNKADWNDWLENLYSYKYSLLSSLSNLFDSANAVTFITKWSEFAIKGLSNILIQSKSSIFEKLNNNENADILLSWFNDDLENLQFINSQDSNVQWNEDQGLLYSSNLSTVQLSKEDIDLDSYSENVVFASHIPIEPNSLDKNSNYLISHRVFTDSSNSSVDLSISISPSSYKEFRYIIIELPINNGIEKVECIYKDRNATTYSSVLADVENRRMVIDLEKILNPEYVNIILTSDKIDGWENGSYYHNFIVSSIRTAQSNILDQPIIYTNPIEFIDSEGEAVNFSSIYTNVPGALEVAVSYYSNNTWSAFVPIQNKISNRFIDVSIYSNKLDIDLQRITPLANSFGSYIVPIEFPNLDTPYYQNGNDLQLILNQSVAYRGVAYDYGKQEHIVELEDISTSGWVKKDGKYETIFIPGNSIEIDFGPYEIEIDGEIISGKKSFNEGQEYSISILSKFWVNIDKTLNKNSIEKQDPYYPYNPRFLIQGYEKAGYSTHGFICEYKCKFVDPDYLYMSSNDDQSLATFIKDQTSSYVAFKCNEDYNRAYKEKAIISISTISSSSKASKMILRFKMPNEFILDSYKVRVA